MKALEGIKVIDLSRFISGPVCAQILGDMGAEVIKVESPDGEYVRQMDPQYEGESLYYMCMNRNKRGITVNTRSEAGKDILRRLFADADIVVQNFKPGIMEKMGFSYEKLHEMNPRLILVSISGYGLTGPMAGYPGFDSLAQALGGLMSQTGPAGGPPYLAGTFVMDYSTAQYAAAGALAALYAREATGEGQHVDCSLLASALALMVDAVPMHKLLGRHRTRMGNKDKNSAPVGSFLTRDKKYVFIVAGPENFWHSLADCMGQPELKEDPRFPNSFERYERAEEINGIVAEWVKTRNAEDVVDLLTEHGVPVAPVLEIPEVLDLPQVKEEGMLVDVPYTGLGTIPTQGFAINMSATPLGVKRGAPRLGEHTEEVLREYGYSSDEIDVLREEKSI